MCLGDWCGVTLTGAGQRVIIRPATSHFYAQSHAHTNTHMVTCAIQACLKMLAHAHTSYSYIRNNTITDSLAHPHTHTHIAFVFFFLTAYLHAFSLTHTATLSLLLCEKPQPLNEAQICPVNWCSHMQTHTKA